MKKIFSSIALLFATLLLNANVAYLIPIKDRNASALTDTVVALPEVSFGGVQQNPERNAYQWFFVTYSDGVVYSLKDVLEGALLTAEGAPTVNVLWIYVDRPNLVYGSKCRLR